MEFIGRERELARIKKTLKAPEQRNVLIYGRRRVGKSELIKQALTDLPDVATVYYECHQTSEADNLESLSVLVAEALSFPPLAFTGIRELIEFLFAQAKDKNITLVLDEYPYLRDAVKGLDSILQTSIDAHREDSRLNIVLCGSYVEIMKSLIEHESPLYGRIDLALELKPMDYFDAAKFYPAFSPEDKVRLYSVFGGIPFYNRLIDQSQSVRDNIIELVTEPGARLESEVPSYLTPRSRRWPTPTKFSGLSHKVTPVGGTCWHSRTSRAVRPWQTCSTSSCHSKSSKSVHPSTTLRTSASLATL